MVIFLSNVNGRQWSPLIANSWGTGMGSTTSDLRWWLPFIKQSSHKQKTEQQEVCLARTFLPEVLRCFFFFRDFFKNTREHQTYDAHAPAVWSGAVHSTTSGFYHSFKPLCKLGLSSIVSSFVDKSKGACKTMYKKIKTKISQNKKSRIDKIDQAGWRAKEFHLF